ncbi:MAG: RpiB/LacA/LacB family sugar-phosphate isomerase [Clostridium sp.]|nr:RpiB/LacA/LacB family sugar-phosphate isomerase [Clostridium sp.]MCM1443935.1 RpiB/LacA/LacB family sugar-phosphate isomerase [Candidatus Amulumruptor caecigallinarius]
MKIGIGNDHRGYKIKNEIIEFLKSKNYDVEDFGTNSEVSTDYPIYAFKVGDAIINKQIDFGILICRTGIGMSIAANKVKGIRCGKCDNATEAKLCKIDNNCNVIAISYEKNIEEIKEILIAFLETNFTNEERHLRRINMIIDREND